jgi:hypothetical protein
VAFRVARFARANRPEKGRHGRLLGPSQKADDVVLIWALGSELDAPEVVRALEQLEPVATRVLVTTSLDIRQAGQTGCRVEVIPDQTMRAGAADKDWALYLERRFARIRESWAPDLEVVAGQSLDAFLTEIAAPRDEPETATPVEVGEDDSETSIARAG